MIGTDSQTSGMGRFLGVVTVRNFLSSAPCYPALGGQHDVRVKR
jgi:hypothetical protein